MIATDTTPKVTFMGKEVPIEEFSSDTNEPLDMADAFKPVAISPAAIDYVSKNVEQKHFREVGVYTFLKKRAEYVFSKMKVNDKEARLKGLIYFFEYGASGPVLKSVKLVQE